MYAIAWKSKNTGFTGQGSPVFDTLQECQNACDEINVKLNTHHHWPVLVAEPIKESAE
jgi:hypothetical protein